jgi:hypothetical protein
MDIGRIARREELSGFVPGQCPAINGLLSKVKVEWMEEGGGSYGKPSNSE